MREALLGALIGCGSIRMQQRGIVDATTTLIRALMRAYSAARMPTWNETMSPRKLRAIALGGHGVAPPAPSNRSRARTSLLRDSG